MYRLAGRATGEVPTAHHTKKTALGKAEQPLYQMACAVAYARVPADVFRP